MAERLSREEFRRWAESQPGRYEQVAAQPVAMSPERAAHGRIKARVWAALDRSIRECGLACEAFNEGLTVEIDEDTDYEPDAVVNCGRPIGPDMTAATNPVIVVEVLAPSTQSIDSSDKLVDYFRLASVQRYLILGALRREVIRHRRTADGVATRIVNLGLTSLDLPRISIDINHIYAEAGVPS
jgi:Uma2 family endonuclease